MFTAKSLAAVCHHTHRPLPLFHTPPAPCPSGHYQPELTFTLSMLENHWGLSSRRDMMWLMFLKAHYN